ncbi:MAG: CmcJ/NvfI family oxidoreductase [Pseudomonadota bacterium]
MTSVNWDQERSAPLSKPVFNYIDAAVPSSLYRNGRVSLHRAPDGNDSALEGYLPDAREIDVCDARQLPRDEAPRLARNGFECFDHPLEDANLDFLDHAAVVRRYYPACEALMRTATGASHVFAFDHNVRWAQGQRDNTRIAGGQQVQGPIRVVHGDYTLTSGPQRLRDLARPPRINDTLRPFYEEGTSIVARELVDAALADGGRFALINVWRNIADEPVARDPLGFCDAQTIEPDDLVVFELHYADRIGENYFAHHAPRHRWFYYDALRREEAVLIKQWDSSGAFAASGGARSDAGADLCTMNFHSAFEDPSTPAQAPERCSIEVRCALVYA